MVGNRPLDGIMSPKLRLDWFTALTVLLLLAGRGYADQPNILLIYIDDLGWKDAGFMGSDYYETPNIDALADGGIVFSNAYSGASNCAPARACLMSGQYTPRHRIFNVGTGPRGKGKHRRLQHVAGVKTLNSKLKTWAHQLQAVGYETATFGKWHLSNDPLPYGFDFNIGGTHSGSPPQGYYAPFSNAPGLGNVKKDVNLTDHLSREAIRFIESNRKKKWCVCLSHFAVHTPIQPHRKLHQKYLDKKTGDLHHSSKMASMIESVDQGVGWIVEALEEMNLREKTLIVFTSDNGGYGPATDMHPLKGYKGTYYEGGIRVPFVANWPGTIPPSRKSDEPIIALDIYPTFCDLASAPLPEDQKLDGVSLTDLFVGKRKKLAPRALYWHFPAYLQSYKGVVDEQRDPLFRSRPCSIVRQGKWKLHQYFEKQEIELYDLSKDIGENENLANQKQAKAKELLQQLGRWQQAIHAPVKFERNEKFDVESESKAKTTKRQQALDAKNGPRR